MDYAVDVGIENDVVNERYNGGHFIYDDKRSYAKLYVFCKSIGLAFYTSTLTTCYVPKFYIIMNVAMFLSTLNRARYEIKHYQRYGTVFTSMDEFDIWKSSQWPKSRTVFSMFELALQIWFFVQIFPPQFVFNDTCEIGKSILKIHILTIFVVYIIIAFFSILLVICVYCGGRHRSETNRNSLYISNHVVSVPLPILLDNNQNYECCICMDVDNIQAWRLLPCGHKFHVSCISIWLRQHETCPICRHDIRIIP